MKIEHGILGVGMVCGLVLVVAAMTPDDFWDRDVTNATSAVAGISDTRAGIVAPVPGSPSMAPGGQNSQGPASLSWGRNVAMAGLTPFTKARSQRFQGRIDMVLVRGADVGWGQVHIWVGNGLDSPQQVSLAPDWYLKYLGCPTVENMHVKGAAFDFDTMQTSDKLYAKTITVNGKTCRLRNDEGFALWSNRLR
jgi:hypothetical protein